MGDSALSTRAGCSVSKKKNSGGDGFSEADFFGDDIDWGEDDETAADAGSNAEVQAEPVDSKDEAVDSEVALSLIHI